MALHSLMFFTLLSLRLYCRPVKRVLFFPKDTLSLKLFMIKIVRQIYF
jgi:hypothetical protein